jgi:predicted nuclease with TOPRIM domain
MPKALSLDDGFDTYGDAFNNAIKELTELMAEREVLDEKVEAMDRRIARLRRAAISVGALCDIYAGQVTTKYPELFPDSIDPDTGLTDAVREVLKGELMFLTPVEIRNHLKTKGYDISKYKNVLASIHTILKRLKDQDEVMVSNRDGRTIYRWKPKNEPEISDDDIPF